MILGLLITLFVVLCFMLIGIILIQKGKGGMGIGNLGGSSQMLFGGSGGQDLFQKITWVFAALFMGGSLALSIMKTRYSGSVHFLNKPAIQVPTPQTPS